MQLDDKAISDLQAIYRATFSAELTKDEAIEIGSRLLELFTLILQSPRPKQGPESREI